jgi:hypothetical protein
MPARPFNRRQALQNQAFLEALRATGNPRLAARLLGVHRSTYTKRRAKCPAFALAWDAALAAAHARLNAGTVARNCPHSNSPRTKGGELVVGRTRGGRLQLRRAPAGWMTKAGEQAFFSALSATANVRLSAAAAGFSHSAFYARKRTRVVFAREMRLALQMGYDRVEGALLESTLDGDFEDEAWRHNDPPPVPPMTCGQAIQLLYLHQKEARLDWDRPHRRKRRGEPWETYTARLAAMWRSEKSKEADDAERRRRAREETPDDRRFAEEGAAALIAPLPPLHLVTGWSKANPERAKATYNPDLALFGGWRLKDWQRKP